MSANDRTYFRNQIMRYKTAYDRDGDASRYLSNCATAALNLFLAEENTLLRKMGKPGLVLPTALSASSPLLMAALDSAADWMSCPVGEGHSALEFLEHFGRTIAGRYDSEYAEPTRKALKAVWDGLQRLGIAG